MNKKVIFITVLISIVTGCSPKSVENETDQQDITVTYLAMDTIATDLAMETEDFTIPKTNIVMPDVISVERFLAFINDNPDSEISDYSQSLSTVDISEHYDIEGKVIHLAKITIDFFWDNMLFLIIVSDNKIVDVIDTGIRGNSHFFSYDIVRLSQGDFIAAYDAHHMGIGNLNLIALSEHDKTEYFIPFAVDHYYEDTQLTAIEYGLISDYEEDGISASAIYLGGKLHAEYDDINQDSHTDIILSGILLIYETGENFKQQILRKKFYIKKVYLYDPEVDDFVFSDEFSESILIED